MGTTSVGSHLPDDDCELVACWDENQNQREVNLVRLSKAAAGG